MDSRIRGAESSRVVALRYSVHRSAIQKIWKGERWNDNSNSEK
jgi:hypothetical protein